MKVVLTVTYEAVGWSPDMLRRALKAVGDLALPQSKQWSGAGDTWSLKGLAVSHELDSPADIGLDVDPLTDDEYRAFREAAGDR